MANATIVNISTDATANSYSSCSRNDFYHCSVFVICSIIFGAGFFGNCFSILILSTMKQYRKKVTFVSINLLCVCDVLALTLTYFTDMFASSEDWAEVHFTTAQCTVLIAVGLSPFLLSIFSVAVLALVRYNLVAHPMRISRLRSRKCVILLHIGGAVVITTVMAIVGHVSLETMSCYHAMYYNGYLVFTHPPMIMGAIIFICTLHVMKVRRLRQSLFARTYNTNTSIRRINKVIYIIMCVFIVCQTPFILTDVLLMLTGLEVVVLSDNFFKTLYNFAIVPYLLNHAINPYIYIISHFMRPTVAPVPVTEPAINRTTTLTKSSSEDENNQRDMQTQEVIRLASFPLTDTWDPQDINRLGDWLVNTIYVVQS